MDRWSTEDFQGTETSLCDTIVIVACHCTSVQAIGCAPPTVNPNVNHEFWVIIMC